ncbi:hypothetical protein HZF05_17745 [Sphingomonas sp. CGMCC 1.13654]|uniref:Uncharacterized protein n=1 Tax=Sphingomonas chungangi TaxID=2683589 RepID=A0A838LCQ6_9SPHN|nr:hypothetical protein [Sphingomonas chungangi]MBA2935926.1 hypothetical protein [Sphingomonas chungangi]MVW54617.1 hypothetical protein [Sphingomonas chungangi]
MLDSLDVPLIECLAGAWPRALEPRRHRGDASVGPVTLLLAEHDLSITLHPEVHVAFDGPGWCQDWFRAGACRAYQGLRAADPGGHIAI